MINARLRHYDSVPYLTMLLFCKSSAAVWPVEERDKEGEKQGVAGRNICTETDIRTEIKRLSDTDRTGI